MAHGYDYIRWLLSLVYLVDFVGLLVELVTVTYTMLSSSSSLFHCVTITICSDCLMMSYWSVSGCCNCCSFFFWLWLLAAELLKLQLVGWLVEFLFGTCWSFGWFDQATQSIGEGTVFKTEIWKVREREWEQGWQYWFRLIMWSVIMCLVTGWCWFGCLYDSAKYISELMDLSFSSLHMLTCCLNLVVVSSSVPAVVIGSWI